MKQTSFLKLNTLVASLSILSITVILGVSTSAAPTQAPPDGNPSFPQGAQGPQGPQGPTGNQGAQGNQGNQGPQGPLGSPGIAWCTWYNGNRFLSHGWDGGCAFQVGARFYCTSGRLTSILRYNSSCNDLWHGHSSHP